MCHTPSTPAGDIPVEGEGGVEDAAGHEEVAEGGEAQQKACNDEQELVEGVKGGDNRIEIDDEVDQDARKNHRLEEEGGGAVPVDVGAINRVHLQPIVRPPLSAEFCP